MIKKRLFGDDHEIQYDTIINHDVYSFLRISVEVPRGQDVRALVFLNGFEIGMVEVLRNEQKKTLGYVAYRKMGNTYVELHQGKTIRKFGQAAASIITNYVS